ncbi:MAG: glutamate racemase [Bacilli bacterium]|nr:glutamate racemase [Bacilli bacterium]
MIGIMDSGIGGATVLKEILKTVPPQQYIYYSDSKNNPYGEKSLEEVNQIVSAIVELLIEKGCKVIVLACNTASALCVEHLRKAYPRIPFIAIEPAYKMVHDYNPKGTTLVLATKGTIQSHKFQNLYKKYNNQNTFLHACIGLAELIEKEKQKEIDDYIKQNLVPFGKIENVVLGCTHYPLIKQNIKKQMGEVLFFDGSAGVSKQVKEWITRNGSPKRKCNEITFIDSSEARNKEERFWNLLKEVEK